MENDQPLKEPVAFHLLGAACVLAVLVLQFLLGRGDNVYVRILGVCCLLLSAFFMFPPFLLLRRHGMPRHNLPYHRTTTVVTTSVYAIVRHPQYLGYVLLAWGFAALVQRPVVWLLAGCAGFAFYVQSIQEEAYCRARMGATYVEYERRVPRCNIPVGLIRYLRRKWREL